MQMYARQQLNKTKPNFIISNTMRLCTKASFYVAKLTERSALCVWMANIEYKAINCCAVRAASPFFVVYRSQYARKVRPINHPLPLTKNPRKGRCHDNMDREAHWWGVLMSQPRAHLEKPRKFPAGIRFNWKSKQHIKENCRMALDDKTSS